MAENGKVGAACLLATVSRPSPNHLSQKTMLPKMRPFLGFATAVFAGCAAGARFGRRGYWLAAGVVYVVAALFPDRLGDD